MEHLKIIGLVGFCACLCFPAIVGAEENDEKPDSMPGVSMLGGTVDHASEFVTETVHETVDTAGTTISESVQTVLNTVEATTEYVEKTGKSITQPQKDREVVPEVAIDTNQLVEHTVHQTGKTVSAVAQESLGSITEISTNTTGLVRETVSGFSEAVHDVPVVKPVVKKADRIINEVTINADDTLKKTDTTVKESMNIVNRDDGKAVGETTGQHSTIIKEESSTMVEMVENEPTEFPVSEGNQNNGMQQEKPKVEGITRNAFVTVDPKNHELKQREMQFTKHDSVQKQSPQEKSTNRSGAGYPLLSLQPSNTGNVGKTAQSSQTFTGSDQLMAILATINDLGRQENQLWYLNGKLMKNQWSNAPPEQPPSSSPFYIN